MERDFLSIDDVSRDELVSLLDRADDIKRDPNRWSDHLRGKHVALIFEKPSTRTRVSFEVAVSSMGGYPVVLRGDELQLGRGETIEDTGRTLSRYVDAIVVRTFGQDRLERLADASDVPVINGLSDFSHPCQCLADLQTIREKKGTLSRLPIAYLGDGNNVAHSLMFGGTKLGMDVRIASPSGYQPFPQVIERSAELAAASGGSLVVTDDVDRAAAGAEILYTDVWVSMGQDADGRHDSLAPFQIGPRLIDLASPDVMVMHCLPAHRGEEITADVIDGPRSIVWDQVENRLHAQKSLLTWLLD